MLVTAIRTNEPWTFLSVLAAIVLLVVVVAVLILALQRGNR
jgi:hypothetical protein